MEPSQVLSHAFLLFVVLPVPAAVVAFKGPPAFRQIAGKTGVLSRHPLNAAQALASAPRRRVSAPSAAHPPPPFAAVPPARRGGRARGSRRESALRRPRPPSLAGKARTPWA